MTAIAAQRHAAARPADKADISARRHRYLLWSLLLLTAVLYLAGLSRNGWANDFYAAAVQAGTRSWKAFFFGSFDASNFITVDKTPASLWVMELSGRLFGVNSWSMLIPQALEGVASVALLYAAVRRWHGPWAALLAGLTLAVTPVAALMFRYNNPDALLVLLLTAAAYATVRAIESGRTRWLVLAGALLGFGFLTKMLQAFLVLPPFGLAYLIAGPRRWLVRLGQLSAGLAAVVTAAGWWVAAVMLTPAADRPYIGGSTDNNILQLAIGYNGLGRIDGDETGSVGFAGNHGAGAGFSGSAGLGRLFAADMGGQISWLLPAALLAIGVLLWLSWRARTSRLATASPGQRPDRDLPAVVLWGGWLLVTGLVFSFMAGIIHPYYTVALAPAIAALIGIGAARSWESARTAPAARYWLAAAVAVTAAWSFALLDRSPAWLPVLRYAILSAGLASAIAIAAAPRLGELAGRPARRRALASTVAGAAAVAALAGPFAYALDTVATSHSGALPTAGPAVAASFGGGGPGGPGGTGGPGGSGRPASSGRPGSLGRSGNPGSAGPSGLGKPGGSAGAVPSGLGGSANGRPGPGTGGTGTGGTGAGGAGTGGTGAGGRLGAGGPGGLNGSTTVSVALTKLLEQHAAQYTWAAATVGSESAAPLQLATGDPIMSIGGFNGTDPAPTLAQFERYVAEHKIHYFVGANSDSFGGGSGDAAAITKWVASHFRSQTVDGETVYNLTDPVSSS
ncbi:MAG TPA: glycosyltransferase family 39 protein [Streptosporangiaceae bacterium]|nr:glycosyltransferase family 39 protein [Streptosporangiaceae bacterium]